MSARRIPPVLTAPLGGLQAIEASAGTGKTWTLCGLYLRVLLEKRVPAARILAITFTKAATAELRERIRARLQETLRALETDREPDDALIAAVLARAGDRTQARLRVLDALCGFDEAPVHTIHGFCQRALADHAFSSRVAFDCALVPDVGELLHGIVADFWRRDVADCRAAGADPRCQRLLIEALGRDALAQLEDWALRMARKEGLIVRAPAQAEPLEAALARFVAAYEHCRRLWLDDRPRIEGMLRDSTALDRRRYRADLVPRWFAQFDAWFEAAERGPQLPKYLERFGATDLAANCRKRPAPAHAFFEAVDGLCAAAAGAARALAAWRTQLHLRLAGYARTELARRLAERNAQSYDDLLVKLQRALADDEGGALAAALRARYPYALIDEFQDTDPLQWSIFRAIYGGADATRHGAFLVGDPKQAIYSFRGADVYAYLDAVSHCGEPVRLSENQRSVPGLVGALNAVFALSPQPFALERIRYEPVRPSGRERPSLVEDRRRDPAPLRIAWLDGQDAAKLRGAGEGRDWASGAVAAEIARLLDAARAGRVRLGERALCAGDIAVLVNTHVQSGAVREALARHGIGAAELSSRSVFHSAQAEELERLLLAAANPRDAAIVRAALATDCIGLDASALVALTDDASWQAVMAEFDAYHETWRAHGPMRMLRGLFRARRVPDNLARFRDGERRLTNLHHLCELLHGHALQAAGMDAAIGWLSARRTDLPNDDTMLRLESDADLVQIVTIHKSKGLEYPVTFVPFLWDGRLRSGDDGMAVHHAPEPPYPLVLDAGTDAFAQALAAARREELAERLRVAYVALTRASNRCYLFAGAIGNVETSALGWLLHGIDGAAGDPAPDAARLRADLDRLVDAAAGQAQIESLDGAGTASLALPERGPALAARTPRAPVPAALALTSFSALRERAPARHDLEPLPDRDPLDDGVSETPPAAGGRFAFPRGSDAGTCLHAILERVDYAAPAWGPVAREQLLRAGYPGAWAGEVEAWLRQALGADLGGFTLADVPRAAQRRELAVQLALPDFRPRRLVEAARAHGLALAELPAAQLRGYLAGFIDLVFVHDGRWYVADWKSNWLGAAPERYAAPALAEAMAQGDYHLQALLYAVALHRWLRHAQAGYDYERHFGGVRYLFLRGMHRDWGARGVHAARPPRALIEAIDAALGARTP